MQQPEAISLRAAAKALGVKASTISRQVRAGIIPNRGKPHDPKVWLDEARLAREGGLDLSKQRGPEAALFARPPSIEEQDEEVETLERLAAAPGAERKPTADKLNYQTARTAREGYSARLQQLELEQRLGNLLDRTEVEDAFFTMTSRMRDEFMAMGAKLGPELVGLAAGEIAAKIEAETRSVLERLSNEFKPGADEPVAA